MDAKGIVGKIIPRNTKVGITYSFTLDDRDDERWFGTFKTPAPAEGTYVEFEYKTNAAGFHNVDMATLVTAEAPEKADAAEPVEVLKPGAAKAFTKTGNKDANIQWQSARNAAIQVLGTMSDAGALSLGSGKAEAKLEAYLIQLNALTLEFFDQSMEVSGSGDAPDGFRG
jgi:hypothetical protein